ncbi:hypothetical protein DFJ73DRAFT_830914 [Zopfochytrium polystomum]|nr:hypothetical protein DFJ73DRAFT_830914 [Zopfochytrium polystomum]
MRSASLRVFGPLVLKVSLHTLTTLHSVPRHPLVFKVSLLAGWSCRIENVGSYFCHAEISVCFFVGTIPFALRQLERAQYITFSLDAHLVLHLPDALIRDTSISTFSFPLLNPRFPTCSQPRNS